MKYNSDSHPDKPPVFDGMRIYGYDYYARGQPCEMIILGRSGTSSEDRCMVGVLTNEPIQR